MQRPERLATQASLRQLYDAVLAAYSSTKRALDAQFVLYRVLYRPVSFPLTVLFIRAGFTANGVSYLNALLLCLVLGLLLSGNGLLLTCAALLFLLFYLLDFVDGNLARYQNQSSYFGKLIDGTIDTVAFLVFTATAIGNTRAGLSLLPGQTEIVLGALITIAALFNQSMQLRIAYLRLESQAAQPRAAGAEDTHSGTPSSASPLVALANWVYRNSLVSTPVVLIPAAFLGQLSWFILVFAVVHGPLGLSATVVSILRCRRSLERPRTH